MRWAIGVLVIGAILWVALSFAIPGMGGWLFRLVALIDLGMAWFLWRRHQGR